MQFKNLKYILILENCFNLKNNETSFNFFSEIVFYFMMPSSKMFESCAYLLEESLVIYYN
jgi:hypothetical protein